MDDEARIVWEGAHVYVYRSRLAIRGFEVRVNTDSFAIVAGWRADEEGAVRCAKRLDANGWQHIIERNRR